MVITNEINVFPSPLKCLYQTDEKARKVRVVTSKHNLGFLGEQNFNTCHVVLSDKNDSSFCVNLSLNVVLIGLVQVPCDLDDEETVQKISEMEKCSKNVKAISIFFFTFLGSMLI